MLDVFKFLKDFDFFVFTRIQNNENTIFILKSFSAYAIFSKSYLKICSEFLSYLIFFTAEDDVSRKPLKNKYCDFIILNIHHGKQFKSSYMSCKIHIAQFFFKRNMNKTGSCSRQILT